MPEGCSEDGVPSDPLWGTLEGMGKGDLDLREEAEVAESNVRDFLSSHNRCPWRKIALRT